MNNKIILEEISRIREMMNLVGFKSPLIFEELLTDKPKNKKLIKESVIGDVLDFIRKRARLSTEPFYRASNNLPGFGNRVEEIATWFGKRIDASDYDAIVSALKTGTKAALNNLSDVQLGYLKKLFDDPNSKILDDLYSEHLELWKRQIPDFEEKDFYEEIQKRIKDGMDEDAAIADALGSQQHKFDYFMLEGKVKKRYKEFINPAKQFENVPITSRKIHKITPPEQLKSGDEVAKFQKWLKKTRKTDPNDPTKPWDHTNPITGSEIGIFEEQSDEMWRRYGADYLADRIRDLAKEVHIETPAEIQRFKKWMKKHGYWTKEEYLSEAGTNLIKKTKKTEEAFEKYKDDYRLSLGYGQKFKEKLKRINLDGGFKGSKEVKTFLYSIFGKIFGPAEYSRCFNFFRPTVYIFFKGLFNIFSSFDTKMDIIASKVYAAIHTINTEEMKALADSTVLTIAAFKRGRDETVKDFIENMLAQVKKEFGTTHPEAVIEFEKYIKKNGTFSDMFVDTAGDVKIPGWLKLISNTGLFKTFTDISKIWKKSNPLHWTLKILQTMGVGVERGLAFMFTGRLKSFRELINGFRINGILPELGWYIGICYAVKFVFTPILIGFCNCVGYYCRTVLGSISPEERTYDPAFPGWVDGEFTFGNILKTIWTQIKSPWVIFEETWDSGMKGTALLTLLPFNVMYDDIQRISIEQSSGEGVSLAKATDDEIIKFLTERNFTEQEANDILVNLNNRTFVDADGRQAILTAMNGRLFQNNVEGFTLYLKLKGKEPGLNNEGKPDWDPTKYKGTDSDSNKYLYLPDEQRFVESTRAESIKLELQPVIEQRLERYLEDVRIYFNQRRYLRAKALCNKILGYTINTTKGKTIQNEASILLKQCEAKIAEQKQKK